LRQPVNDSLGIRVESASSLKKTALAAVKDAADSHGIGENSIEDYIGGVRNNQAVEATLVYLFSQVGKVASKEATFCIWMMVFSAALGLSSAI
jgi:hypothetical protein